MSINLILKRVHELIALGPYGLHGLLFPLMEVLKINFVNNRKDNPYSPYHVLACQDYSPKPNKFNLSSRNFSIHLRAKERLLARILKR